ncbi:MAG: hypothetical protein EXS43_12495 [Opitutus sp.]|nr:hypothetical protein [Opitutus sp.]
MPATRRHTPLAERLRRLFAAGSALLVFGLTVFAASPKLHEWLHAAGTPTSEEGCPITLFSSGVSLPLDTVAALPPVLIGHAPSAAVAVEIFVAPPRYLLRPERGPPGQV